jgi:hypothetical protein
MATKSSELYLAKKRIPIPTSIIDEEAVYSLSGERFFSTRIRHRRPDEGTRLILWSWIRTIQFYQHRKCGMKTKSPRERAARALCRLAGNPENAIYNGKPMWMSFLPEADAALEAALPTEVWERVKAEELE